jgi:ubiquinone/menaquinone biosynthesis C-methylase UbiE
MKSFPCSVLKINTIMSKENSSIHEFDVNLICEYFSLMERQGPGSPEVTLKALSFIDKLSPESRIADMGCGTGAQTMLLAQNIPGHITGIDLFPGFIDIFNAHVRKLHFQEKVTGIVANMERLPFENGELDLIWSEGAIYNMGFERGINEWRSFLKPGGYIAVTEASWFTEERPAEINEFWKNAYAEIDTIPKKMAQLAKAAYIPVAAFILPENCWTEYFYKAQVRVQEDFLKKYEGNSTIEAFIANERREAQLYSKYKEYYGYVFYIGKKI